MAAPLGLPRDGHREATSEAPSITRQYEICAEIQDKAPSRRRMQAGVF
jgi:hypothetical protein